MTILYSCGSDIVPASSAVLSCTVTRSPSFSRSSVGVLVRHGADGPRDAEPVDARQFDLRTHLHVQIECQRLALVELEIVDVRLRRNLEILALEDRLVRFLHEVLDGLLPDGIGEALEHHLRGSLSGAEPGKADLGCITTGRTLGGCAHLVGVDRNLEQALRAVGLFGGNLDVHAWQEFNIGSGGSKFRGTDCVESGRIFRPGSRVPSPREVPCWFV
jgi:hypothetical protein